MSLDIQEYRIQPLDVLSVSFETLSDENDAFDFLSKLAIQQGRTGGANAAASGIVVNTEGFIEFAVLGDIKVAGLTVFEAQDTIKAVASKFIPDVIVRVRMLNFRFTVLGAGEWRENGHFSDDKVNHDGSYRTSRRPRGIGGSKPGKSHSTKWQ